MVLEVVLVDLRAKCGSYLLNGAHLVNLVHDTLLPEKVEVANDEGSESAYIPLKLCVVGIIIIFVSLLYATAKFLLRLLLLAASHRRHTLMLPL